MVKVSSGVFLIDKVPEEEGFFVIDHTETIVLESTIEESIKVFLVQKQNGIYSPVVGTYLITISVEYIGLISYKSVTYYVDMLVPSNDTLEKYGIPAIPYLLYTHDPPISVSHSGHTFFAVTRRRESTIEYSKWIVETPLNGHVVFRTRGVSENLARKLLSTI